MGTLLGGVSSESTDEESKENGSSSSSSRQKWASSAIELQDLSRKPLLPDASSYSGFLKRKTALCAWKSRWFVLRGGTLFCHSVGSAGSRGKPEKSYRLGVVREVAIFVGCRRLDVQLEDERLELRASSAVDLLAWAKRLRAALRSSRQLAGKAKKMITEEAKAHVDYAKHVQSV